MQRVTITLDDDLMVELDSFIAARGYQNRSEAIRDLARAGMRETTDHVQHGRDCVAALVYTYDHEARQLSRRLTRVFHDHHELSQASLHVHLDPHTCLEITVLRGPDVDIRNFGERVIAERGVRHGRLVPMPLDTSIASKKRSSAAHTHAAKKRTPNRKKTNGMRSRRR